MGAVSLSRGEAGRVWPDTAPIGKSVAGDSWRNGHAGVAHIGFVVAGTYVARVDAEKESLVRRYVVCLQSVPDCDRILSLLSGQRASARTDQSVALGDGHVAAVFSHCACSVWTEKYQKDLKQLPVIARLERCLWGRYPLLERLLHRPSPR